MSDRPIIFSAPMIRALLDGGKTQTRRIAKITAIMGNKVSVGPHERLIELEAGEFRSGICHYESTSALSGPYQLPAAIGDRLWVREAWRVGLYYEDLKPSALMGSEIVDYLAATTTAGWSMGRKRSPIHMPRWASRLTLIVTDVRVQRLQEISEDDAVAEGATSRPACSGFLGREDGWSMDWSRVGELSRWATRKPGGPAKAPLSETDISLCDPKMAFASYWNEIHGPDAWEANPWVVALTFSVAGPTSGGKTRTSGATDG